MNLARQFEIQRHEKFAVIVHSCQTAVAMDIVGHAFDQSRPTIRDTWFPLSKKQHQRLGLPDIDGRDMPKPSYPFPSKKGSVYGQCSSNSTVMFALLKCLGDSYPTQWVDLQDLVLSCHQMIHSLRDYEGHERLDKFQAHEANPRADCGLVIPVGVAIGYYSAVTDLGIDIVNLLCYNVCGALGMGSWQSRTALAIAMLSQSLADSGYIGIADIEMLLEFQLFSDLGREVVESWIMPGHLDPDFYRALPSESELPELYRLSRSEQTLIRALFFLLRIATQYKDDYLPYSTVPKENLTEVFSHLEWGTDIAFLFGALATLSEQTGDNGCYKLLIPEQLVTDSPYAETARELLKDIKGV